MYRVEFVDRDGVRSPGPAWSSLDEACRAALAEVTRVPAPGAGPVEAVIRDPEGRVAWKSDHYVVVTEHDTHGTERSRHVTGDREFAVHGAEVLAESCTRLRSVTVTDTLEEKVIAEWVRPDAFRFDVERPWTATLKETLLRAARAAAARAADAGRS